MLAQAITGTDRTQNDRPYGRSFRVQAVSIVNLVANRGCTLGRTPR